MEGSKKPLTQVQVSNVSSSHGFTTARELIQNSFESPKREESGKSTFHNQTFEKRPFLMENKPVVQAPIPKEEKQVPSPLKKKRVFLDVSEESETPLPSQKVQIVESELPKPPEPLKVPETPIVEPQTATPSESTMVIQF